MRVLIIFLGLALIHTSTLWSPSTHLAGTMGDSFAHASMPQWFCRQVIKGDLHLEQFLAPWGANASTNYDSPFPLVLTCPFVEMGGIAQFHLFIFFQICLIILSAWIVSREIFPQNRVWQTAYILFVWFTGFYFSQSQEHFTLMSGVWGFQFLLWATTTADLRNRKNLVIRGALVGLAFSGTFHNIAMLTLPVLALSLLVVLRGERLDSGILINLLLAIFSSAFVVGFFFFPAIYTYLSQDLVSTPWVRNLYSADVIGLFLPSNTSRLYWLAFQVLPPMNVVIHFERINSVDALVWIPLGASLFHLRLWKQREYQVLLGLALLFFAISMGPVVEFQGSSLFPNPINRLLGIFPFSLSRTPGRFLLVTVLSLTYLAFCIAKKMWGERRWFSKLSFFVVVWGLVGGPLLNDTPFVRTTELSSIVPDKALKAIREDSTSKIVANIPAAPIADATQNFLQLYHTKPITGGYLAYTAYTNQRFPWPLQALNPCTPEIGHIPLSPDTRDLLNQLGIRHIIVNKDLIGDPSCKAVIEWLSAFASQSWVQRIDENNHYVTLQTL